MEKIGLISTNLAEKIALTVTESPYRVSADIISDICGQTISHGGIWNLIQQLGERISEEEEYAVQQMEADLAEGKRAVGILFEEMDGVWLRMQDSRHKKAPKQEMKGVGCGQPEKEPPCEQEDAGGDGEKRPVPSKTGSTD